MEYIRVANHFFFPGFVLCVLAVITLPRGVLFSACIHVYVVKHNETCFKNTLRGNTITSNTHETNIRI